MEEVEEYKAVVDAGVSVAVGGRDGARTTTTTMAAAVAVVEAADEERRRQR